MLKIRVGMMLLLCRVRSISVFRATVLVCWFLFLTLLGMILVWSSDFSLFCCCCKLDRNFLPWAFGHIGLWVERVYSFPPCVMVKLFGCYYLMTDFCTTFDAVSLPSVCTFVVPWFVGGVSSASHLSRQ